MIFGTWNVRTLNETAAVKTLVDEIAKYHIKILSIQEMRWLGSGEQQIGDYCFYYKGGNKRMLGVGFAIHKSIKNNVIQFRPINERMCALRVRTKFFNLTIINVHAEHEESNEIDKDTFYTELEQAYDNSPSHDVKLIMGDMNAKIGNEEVYRPVIGKESLHKESNNNGMRIIDFATSRNMIISSTCFPRKDIHKYTWISPDGKTKNQIDHVLIDKKAASNVMNVRTYRGADCDSDHFLVGVRYRCRISNNPPLQHKKVEKFDLENLKTERTQLQYQSVLDEKLKHVTDVVSSEDFEMDVNWRELKETVTSTAQNVIGYEKKVKKKDWFDEECKTAIENKKRHRQLFLQRKTRQREEEYKKARTEAKHLLRRKKRSYTNGYIIRMQQQFQENDPKKAYKELNFFRKGFKPSCKICKNPDGQVITQQDEVIKRWKDFFEQLLNNNNTTNQVQEDPRMMWESEEESNPPTLSEVAQVVKHLKNHKAPGKDNIPAELFKYGGDSVVIALHNIIKKVWKDEAIPTEWQESIICPIYKKGDKFDCKNYRGISLLNTAYKIFTAILKNRMEIYAERAVGQYQAGFRRGKSTMDQLFTVRQVLRKCWEFDIDVYQLFVDFRQAYDSINRHALYSTMLDLEIPPKLVRLTKATMDNSRNYVRIQGQLSEEFSVIQGLKQGDSLAPMLFNLALEGVIRKVSVDNNGNLCYKSKQLAAYADDINCLARSLLSLKEIFIELEVAAKNIGLEVNEDKTKIMVQSRSTRRRLSQNITIGDNNFERVNEFRYLGSILTVDNDENIDLQARIKAANNAYYSLLPVMKSKAVHRKTKVMLYKTLIRSVITYGSEAWTITQKTAKTLDAFERKILRKIYGPVKDNDEWRIRYNDELYEMYKSPSLSAHIKLMRLRWAGHLQRQSDNRVPKKMINSDPQGGVRPKGRPRSRWEDEITKDATQLLKVNNWKDVAKDRNIWKSKLQEAQVRIGP